MMIRRSILPAVLALTLLAAALPPATADAVDDYVTAQMARRRIPGLDLAVVQRGQVVKMQGYGLASVELDLPVTPDSVFELASLTKQFTASAVMKLVEEGKVGRDDPVTKYVAGAPATWNAITIRHLLTHTSGLASLASRWARTTASSPP
jgi:CubicO group peptidase (beta-lactamase class C family)